MGLVEIIAYFFVDLLTTYCTLVGVVSRGNFFGRQICRARAAPARDAVGHNVRRGKGTSTVDGYIESAAGVAAPDARYGTRQVAIAGIFSLRLFLSAGQCVLRYATENRADSSRRADVGKSVVRGHCRGRLSEGFLRFSRYGGDSLTSGVARV